MSNRRSRWQRKQPSLSPLPETDDTSEPFTEDSLGEVKDEKQNTESLLDELFCQLSRSIYENADKKLIPKAQQKLMRAKEKAFSVMTELCKIYLAHGEKMNTALMLVL